MTHAPKHVTAQSTKQSAQPSTKQCRAPRPYSSVDVLIIGAGASGLYCAMTAGRRGRSVLLIDHANKAGKKILMSGGGRCNFTNYVVEPEHFTGDNAHFCKSALSRHPNWEFIALVEQHGIAYHEREHGQLFCLDSAKDVVTMLLAECTQAEVSLRLNTSVTTIVPLPDDAGFAVSTTATASTKDTSATPLAQTIHCQSLVIATGGLSIPTMGATGFGYQVAEQFGHRLIPTQAGLVPFTFTDAVGEMIKSLAGTSLEVIAFNEHISFALPMLFTHRGLSGPAMLQLSNYWRLGENIHINLLPTLDVAAHLLSHKVQHPRQRLRTALGEQLPKKLLMALQDQLWADIADTPLADLKDERLIQLGETLNGWTLKPSGTEGYRTAEVTLGGVATTDISSKTMQSQLQPHLYFIGEVLDVTGWLGGYNFQWAWASGHACGQVV